MADVGVLNLQIQADASQASTSLSALADALTRVKNAVGKGLSFGKLPTQLGKIREALGGNWGGSEQFKTAMTNLKYGANAIAKANVGEKLANDAKGITAWVTAYQKVINTLNSVKKQDTASSKVESTVSSATSGMAQNASTFSSAMFGGRFAQHFYALNDPDSGYGKVVSDIKTQTEAVSNAVTTSGAKIKDAVSNSTEAMKSGVSADAASGFKEIENTLKQMDAGTVQNIVSLASALKELKGASGIGKQLNDAAVGLNAVLKFDGSNKGTSGTIERIGTALKHFGEKTTDFKVPSFNNLIKLAEALQKGFFASVEIENIAKALEHLKQASDGFVMPNLSGLTKLSSALAGTGVADAKAVAGMQKVGSTVDETVGKMEQLGSVTDTNGVSGQITDLFARLNSPIDYSKLGEFAGQMAGIGQSANVTKQELDVFATDASQKIDSLIQHLNAPVSYKGLKEFVDFSQGGGRSFKSSEQDWEALFKIGEGASSASKQLVAMQQAVDNVTGSYMRLEVAGQQAMYVPRSPEDVKADRNNALSRMQDNQARREAVWSSETSDNMRNAQEQIYAVKGAADQATQSVQNLHNAVNTQTGVNANQMVPNTGAIDGASQSIANYADTVRNVDTVVNSMSSDQARMISEATSLESQINSLADTELMMRDNLVQDIQAGRLDANQIAERAAQIRLLQTEQANLYARLVEMEHAQRISTRAMNALKGAFQNLREGMSKLPFVGLIKQMMRMARMRALRYMIRELAKGFREGVENVYHYSEAIGGSFHESMDSAATALNQMKNSIGAAVSPALQALIPLFNTIVGWITTATNYLNQFFSLLSGKSTWTRALPVATKAFDEQKKAAKGASDSVKDMLADFDELNIIQQNGSGSGSGGSGSDTNYAEMFEEVNEFDGKIKDMVQWIQDHMETVEGIAKAIGIAILGWKISKAFSGALGTLGGILAGGAIAAIGLQVIYEGAYNAGLNGEFGTDEIVATIAGNIATAAGGAIIGYKIGGPGGALMGAVVGLGIGIAVSIEAYEKGKRVAAELARWGTFKMSAEQVKEMIESMYSFDINAQIELVGASVENMKEAKDKLNASIFVLSLLLNKIKVSTNLDKDAEMKKLKEACDQVIADLNAEMLEGQNSLDILLGNVKIYNEEGTDISNDLINNIKLNDQTVLDYMNNLGRMMAEAMYEGERTGWANGEYEQMMDLAERQQKILNGARQTQLQFEMEQTVGDIMDGVDFENLDKESAMAIMTALNEYESKYTDSLRALMKEQRDFANYKAALADQQIADLNDNWQNDGLTFEQYTEQLAKLEKAKADFLAAADKLTDSKIDEAIREQLGIDDIRKEIQHLMEATFQQNYAEAWEFDVAGTLDEALNQQRMGNNKFTVSYENGLFNQDKTTLSNLFKQANDVDSVAKTINQLLTKALPSEAQDALAIYRDDLKGAYLAIAPMEMQKQIYDAVSQKADILQLTGDEKKKFVDNVMTQLYRDDHSLYAQLLAAMGENQWEQYRLYLPVHIQLEGVLEDVDQAFIESIFTELEGEDFTSSGQSIYDYVKEKYGTVIADVIEEIIKETESSGQTREDIYRMMFGDDFIEYRGSHNPTTLRGANAGGPFGPAPERRMNAMQLVWDIEEGLNMAFGGEDLTPGESNMFVQPIEYTEDTDDRTANATEAMQQDIVTQNDKIDRVERLLTAVLSRLNAGLNVNMAPTSTGGRMVNGMLDAFTRVTGNN